MALTFTYKAHHFNLLTVWGSDDIWCIQPSPSSSLEPHITHSIPTPTLSTALHSHSFTFCLWGLGYSGYFICMECVAVCVPLVSLSIMCFRVPHGVAGIRSPFPFMAEECALVQIHHSLCIHSSTDRHLHCSYLLATVNNADINVHVQVLVGHLFSILLGAHLKWLGHMLILFLAFWGTANLASIVLKCEHNGSTLVCPPRWLALHGTRASSHVWCLITYTISSLISNGRFPRRRGCVLFILILHVPIACSIRPNLLVIPFPCRRELLDKLLSTSWFLS